MENVFLPSKNPCGNSANVSDVPFKYSTFEFLSSSFCTFASPYIVPLFPFPLISVITEPSVFSKSYESTGAFCSSSSFSCADPFPHFCITALYSSSVTRIGVPCLAREGMVYISGEENSPVESASVTSG